VTNLADVSTLSTSIRGSVLLPSNPAYDATRQIWNGMIDRRPAVIIRCAGAADVIAAVRFARESGLEVAVRGGGHSFPGYSVCDGGLMIDLQDMKGIRVDPNARRVRAQAGVTWSEFDRETQAFGLATTGGMIPHTGIAGLTLGGGFGWLVRKHGMTVDNLLAVDVVTADGQLLHASENENDDLFWAIRGGGGNFGIVTSFEYRVHPLGLILGGLVAYPHAQSSQVLRGLHELVTGAPDELVAVGAMLTTPDGHAATAVAVCYSGDDLVAGERVIAPFRKLGTPVMDQIGPMPYTAIQSMLNDAAVPHRRYYMRSNLLDDVNAGTVDVLEKAYQKVPSPLTSVVLVSMGGAASRVPPDATAYVHRDAAYSLTIIGGWLDAVDDAANVSWLRETWDTLTPHLPNRVYVNELHDEGHDRVRAAYGAVYSRLATLKQKYDPTNFFRLNQNIKPA